MKLEGINVLKSSTGFLQTVLVFNISHVSALNILIDSYPGRALLCIPLGQ